MQNNPELDLAWRFIQNTGTNLFLTGKAGTGKTTFLKNLKEHSPKRMVVLAPTGIAAINAGGVTIHSFCQLPFSPYIPNTTFKSGKSQFRFGKEKIKIIRSMDLLVIDEISMVRADLLDAMDMVLRRYRDRRQPFGGVQLLLIGDLQQLAPVVKDEEWNILKQYYVTPFFFSSNALKNANYMTIELKTVYRQQDGRFLELLNRIREGSADNEVFEALNQRYIPNFVPPSNDDYIRLTTHNYQAQRINDDELAKLTTPSYSFNAVVTGTFPEGSYPADETLTIKNGAQIMFLKNDTSGEHRYFNGMIGEVVDVTNKSITVKSKYDDNVFGLQPEEWTNARYVLDKETLEITEEVDGTFKQYPIRLAWAITIHKSQGLTFEHVVIDAHSSFAHGQTYVALSRCKTMEGMVLGARLTPSSIISDSSIDEFTRQSELRTPDDVTLKSLERAYTLHLIDELFAMSELNDSFDKMLLLITGHFSSKYSKLLAEYRKCAVSLQQLRTIAGKFKLQYTQLLDDAHGDVTDVMLQSRIHSAASYFVSNIEPLKTLASISNIATQNKELITTVKERQQAFSDAVKFTLQMMKYESAETTTFTVSDFLNIKAKLILGTLSDKKTKVAKASKPKKEKIDTKLVSYDMFRSGKTIGQIATERALTYNTIVNHLIHYIGTGEIKPSELMDASKMTEILQYVASHPSEQTTLVMIKENVSATITYTEIKVALAALNKNAK